MTGGWASYSWVAGLVLCSIMLVFLLDFGAARYVEVNHQGLHASDQNDVRVTTIGKPVFAGIYNDTNKASDASPSSVEKGRSEALVADVERSFRQQIAAFLILEFGVIFHSVIIGLNLGTAGDRFSTLYPVLVFHQSFEGLGIGARLSAIPIPEHLNWLPWALCSTHGLTTPIAIAIGLGLRTTYNGGSFTANVISGVLNSISAGILIYTGLVELLARDFLFNPERTRNNKKLTFMITCVFVGAGVMALLGKWA